jgi:putative nucleotidyltransferase with HDIG domain
MRWYPPLVVLATVSIVVLPAALAALIVPPGGLASMAMSAGLAVVLSLVLASAEAWLWKRWHRSRDVLFSDLTLWGCARRWWTERRLRNVRSSYEAAVQADGPVRVELLEGLSRLLAARSAYTYGHCRRVARHAEAIARAMGLAEAEVARIRTAAVVHDVGKVYTPRAILDKPGALTDEEFAVVKLHSNDGADMLRSVRDPQLEAIVRHHHERLDGSGYPDGLAGEQIPLGARIIAVADTFDAVTSVRPYRGAHSHQEGLEILAGEAGSQLDGEAVAAFRERYSARRSVAPLAFLTAVSARALVPLGLASGGLGAGASLGQLAPTLGAAGLLALVPAGGHLRSALGGRTSPPAPVHVQRPTLAPDAAQTGTGSQEAATVHAPTHSREASQPAQRPMAIALQPTGRSVDAPSTATPASPETPRTGGQPTGASPSVANPSAPITTSSQPASTSPAPVTAPSTPTATSPATPSAPTTTAPTTTTSEAPSSTARLPVEVSTGSPATVTISTPVGSVSASVEPVGEAVSGVLASRPANLLP